MRWSFNSIDVDHSGEIDDVELMEALRVTRSAFTDAVIGLVVPDGGSILTFTQCVRDRTAAVFRRCAGRGVCLISPPRRL